MTSGYIKSIDGDVIKAVGIPFTSPFPGNTDLHGEYFDAKTDFGILDKAMVYFNHNFFGTTPEEKMLEKAFAGEILGIASKSDVTEEGVLYDIILDKGKKYIGIIQSLIKDGVLAISSGAKYGERDKENAGRISKWHVVELSLTPNPANPNARMLAKTMLEKALNEGELLMEENTNATPEQTPEPEQDVQTAVAQIFEQAETAKSAVELEVTADLLAKTEILLDRVSQLFEEFASLAKTVKSIEATLPMLAQKIVESKSSSFEKAAMQNIAPNQSVAHDYVTPINRPGAPVLRVPTNGRG